MSLVHRLFNIYLGVPTALLAVDGNHGWSRRDSGDGGSTADGGSIALIQTAKCVFVGRKGLQNGTYAGEVLLCCDSAHIVDDCAILATKLQVNKAALKHSEICNETDGNAKRVISILQTILVTFTAFAMPCFFSSVLHFYCQYNQLRTSVAMDTPEDGVSSIANYFSIIASTSNFFIYIVQSKAYRRRLIHMLHLQQYQWFRALNDGGVKSI
ncbi:hypothetical protein TSMEX_003966 [Taenia solium]|eukprot:TsM_000344800 transcript=TsM_000344800 gene=TsM_000344800